MRIFKIVSSMRTGMWFVPVICVVAGMALSFATIAFEDRFESGVIPPSMTGGPESALAILQTVAVSMVSLTALVLTVTMVVVQLAMGQFSPRIVQTILRDKPSQLAIGIFVATFAHAILAMRHIDFATGKVPGLAIVVAFVLVLVSIATLVIYVHHIGQALRVASLIELVGHDTRRLLDETYPDHGPPPVDDQREVLATSSGVLSHIDQRHLVHLAHDADCRLVLERTMGEFVPAGTRLFKVLGDPRRLDHGRVRAAVVLTLERTLDQDVAYGFRMLVDIAERSLAESSFQDPTTAVQAIDRLHDLLRQIAKREFPNGDHHDEQGEVRLVMPSMDWDAYVHLAFDEIRLAGAGSPQVSRRLRAALEDLKTVAPPERIPVLDAELASLERLTKDALDCEHDVLDLSNSDRMGIGTESGQTDGREESELRSVGGASAGR